MFSLYQKSLQPKKCILIDADLHTALRELESYAHAQARPEMIKRIANEMLLLGVHPQTIGARQLSEALSIVVQDERALMDLKHCVYPIVGKTCSSSWQCVERNIRHTIETVWTSGNLSHIQKRFGFTVEAERGKPTNKAFLAQIAEHIRLEHA